MRDRLLTTPWPLTLLVALVVVLPIVVQGELSAAETRQRVRDEHHAATARVAEQAAASLSAAIRQIRGRIASVAVRPVTGKPTQLIDALQRGDGVSVQAQVETLQALIGDIARGGDGSGRPGAFSSLVAVTDAAGTVLHQSLGPSGHSIAETPYWPEIRRASAAEPLTVSQVHRGEPGLRVVGTNPTTLSIYVAAYIDRGRGETPVYLFAWQSVQRVVADTLQPLFPSVDELYVIDGTGRMILRRSQAFSPDPAALADLSTQPSVAAALRGRSATFEGDDPVGRGHRLIASAQAPDAGWTVIAEQSTTAIDQLDASLAQQRALRGILVALLLVVTFLYARSASQIARQRRTLRETNVALAHATEAKSKFLASMSHELRTPMNAIVGFTDVLLAGVYGELNERQKLSLGYVQQGGRDLLALVDDVLDLSRIEADRIVLAPERFSPLDHVDLVLAQLRPVAEVDHTQLYWRDRGAPAEVVTDRGRLRQILTNLVGNALKFAKGGEVSVAVSTQDGQVRFAVADTGRGVPADQRETIFEEFRQAKAGDPGTGLGLPISRRLARLMGGDLTLESHEGRGSTFTLTLPLELTVAATA